MDGSSIARRAAAALGFALLFAACAPPARADVTPDAARVIARYVEATGGAAALAGETTLYTHATIEAFGFQGVMESWSAQPDRHASHTKLGPFDLSDGTLGAVSWRTDPTTGREVTLADRDSIDALEATWFALERWALPGGEGGTIRVTGREQDSTGATTVLTITAPGAARTHRMWFSDATGLLVREEMQHDNLTASTRYEEWRTVAGRKRATRTRAALQNMPANAMVTSADSFAVGVDVSGVAFARPGTGGGNALRWIGAQGAITIPFEYRAKHVWIHVSLDGGPPQDFIFDTGASVTVIDSAFAAAHGMRAKGYMQMAGAGAAGSASFTTLGSLGLSAPGGAGVEVRDLNVAVVNVAPTFARYFWGEIAGVVGYDVISRFVVTIDYDRRQLVLHDPKTFVYDGHEAPLPLKLSGVLPSVEAVLDGRYRGDFRLDVGSSSTVDLHTPFGRAHRLDKRLRDPHEVAGAGLGGQFSNSLGRLKTMSIGPYTWKDPMVTVSRAVEGAFASRDFAGNIGNRILERFRVTLDYEHRRIWLEPGARYRERDSFTRSGLLLGRSPAGIDAMAVMPGSPAARAGIEYGDAIDTIEGRPAASWKLTEVEDLLENGPEGRRVTLGIRRGDVTKTVTFALREVLK